MNLVSHDVSVGSLGVAAAVVAVEIVVFVVAYTFTVETTSNQRRNIKATDTATSVSAAVDLEVVPSAVVLSCCCWNNSRNNTKSLKFYHNVVINSRQFERLIFGYRTCLNSGWLVSWCITSLHWLKWWHLCKNIESENKKLQKYLMAESFTQLWRTITNNSRLLSMTTTGRRVRDRQHEGARGWTRVRSRIG